MLSDSTNWARQCPGFPLSSVGSRPKGWQCPSCSGKGKACWQSTWPGRWDHSLGEAELLSSQRIHAASLTVAIPHKGCSHTASGRFCSSCILGRVWGRSCCRCWLGLRGPACVPWGSRIHWAFLPFLGTQAPVPGPWICSPGGQGSRSGSSGLLQGSLWVSLVTVFVEGRRGGSASEPRLPVPAGCSPSIPAWPLLPAPSRGARSPPRTTSPYSLGACSHTSGSARPMGCPPGRGQAGRLDPRAGQLWAGFRTDLHLAG